MNTNLHSTTMGELNERLYAAESALVVAGSMGKAISALLGKLAEPMALTGDPDDYALFSAVEACVDRLNDAVEPALNASSR